MLHERIPSDGAAATACVCRIGEAGPAGCSRQASRRADALIGEHYDTLLGIARAKRRRARLGETVATVDLLHDAYVRLGSAARFADDAHFIRSVNLAMRHVIVDHARRKLAHKRGGGERAVTFDERAPVLPEFSETPEEIVGIARLLKSLEAVNPRWLLVVDARYFGGMTEDEAAEVLGVSARTIRRDWAEARQWLASRMGLATA